jgi:hypothetical protein
MLCPHNIYCQDLTSRATRSPWKVSNWAVAKPLWLWEGQEVTSPTVDPFVPLGHSLKATCLPSISWNTTIAHLISQIWR